MLIHHGARLDQVLKGLLLSIFGLGALDEFWEFLSSFEVPIQ